MRGWLPLAAVCLGSLMFLLDTTVVAVALPDVARSFGASLRGLQWVANGYTLVLAVAMLPAGAYADRLGARRVYLTGLAVFALASLACGFAPDTGALIAARAVQGLGGAALAVTAFALIAHIYQGRAMASAMSVWGAVTGLGAAAGPMVGGVLTQYLDWRAIFFINLPLTLLAVVLTLKCLPNPSFAEVDSQDGRRPGAEKRVSKASGPVGATSRGRLGPIGAASRGRVVDPLGTLLFAVVAAGLTDALTTAGADGWDRTRVLLGLGAACVALVLFVAVELRQERPLVDLRLFTRPLFGVVLACVLASSVAFACLIYTSVWLQTGLGLSPVRTGLALMPMALATFVTSTVTTRLPRSLPPRYGIAVGLVLCAAGCALQSGLDAGSGASSITLGLAVTGVGVALLVPASGVVLTVVPATRRGMAAGASMTARQLGQTLGVALLGVLYATSSRTSGTATSSGSHASWGEAAGGGGSASAAHALDHVYLAASAVSLLGAALALAALNPMPTRSRLARWVRRAF
ncbi:MFS transporter [Actinomadura rupiterrae]|uniref:MFS transporter n=1 Tax=Actinomadura rupiterrae TaxID=559627 RepID=UPI0020A43DD5|nr:MFS transporter [Actinomadura rupiterrae]MCP2335801.1 MFS family permease [Actinomadura rupiterrae]